MALQIVDGCTNCHACLPLCPGEAIREARPHFMIDAAACTECLGDFADPQCASICPIEGVIVDAQNRQIDFSHDAAHVPDGVDGLLSPR